MIDKRLQLLLPSKPESLDAIRREVCNFVQGTGYEGRSSDILLAVSEACTNVVRHAYQNKFKPTKDTKKLINVECIIKKNCLTIFVCDRGKGIDTLKRATIFNEEGGFGLYLMRQICDKFKCHSSRFGTVIELGFDSLEPVDNNSNVGKFFWRNLNIFKVIKAKLADILKAPKKNLIVCIDKFNSGLLRPPNKIKAFLGLLLLTSFIKSKIDNLPLALEKKDYDFAKALISDLNKHIKCAALFLNQLSYSRREAHKLKLEKYLAVLQEAENLLTKNEQALISAGSGIYDLIRQRELISLIQNVIADYNYIVDNSQQCWIALEEKLLKII